LRFRCSRCGRCCSGALGRVALELYPSDIEALKNYGYEDFYYTDDKGRLRMMNGEHGSCIFYRGHLCGLMLDHGFFPWNCQVYPLRCVEMKDFFLIEINPHAVDSCPGIGKGWQIKDTLLPELVRGIVSIKVMKDPRALPMDIALSLANVYWG